MDRRGPRFEVKAYLIYLAALCSVFALQIMMACIHVLAWTSAVPPAMAMWTGIPTPGGAPGYIHAINLMVWSVPGIVSMRWILGFIHGYRPAWTKVLAGYALSGVLVWGLVAVAEASPISSAVWQLVGIGISLTLGYAFARQFVLKTPKEVVVATELEGA